MKTFIYKAKKGPEETIEGKMAAANANDIVYKLSQQGYVATYVQEEKAANYHRNNWRAFFGVKQKDLISFTKQLGTLLKAGVPMLRSLNVLAIQTKDKYFSYVINTIADKIKNGLEFSDSLREYPKIFSLFYISMIRSGENSGSLERSLTRIAEYYHKQMRLIAKIRAALAYPVLVLTVGVATIIFVFTTVMPRIVPLLLRLETKLPLSTKILIGISDIITKGWPVIILLIAVFLVIFARAMQNKNFKYQLSNLKIGIPLFGNLIFKSEIARLARALEVALESGVPIIQAIEVSLPIIKETYISENLGKSLHGVEKGESLSAALEKTGILPFFVINLITVGEESGNLSGALAGIAESYEEECNDAIDVMVDLLEPVMILAIGLIVGFIVSAILLPIFQLNIVQL